MVSRMRTRKGVALIQIVLLVVLGVALLVGYHEATEMVQTALDDSDARQAMDYNTTGNQTGENTSMITPDKIQVPVHKECKVNEILINPILSPSGKTVHITVKVEKVSGQDPFPITLMISGIERETKQVYFGDSVETEAYFDVDIEQQGKYEAHVLNLRASFEVRVMPVVVEWISVSSLNADLGQEIKVTFNVTNPNGVDVEDMVWVESIPEMFHYPVEVPADTQKVFTFNISKEHAGNYILRINEKEINFTIMDSEDHFIPETHEFVWSPIEWEPDPLTWNMTSKLPPEASPLRLSMPVPIDSLYGLRWAGIGGMGLHAGGHIEGLDHVWIESTSMEPVKSWANGTVTWIELSGDVEQGEYHIGIDYGYNLTGIHMEIALPLVEVGDFVMRGDPIGQGMDFFGGLQSAEMSLIDAGRTDGIWNGGEGVLVSPFDYLVEEERIALAEAYLENIIDPWVKTGEFNGMFDPAQPYFTNHLLIHSVNYTLNGEWYLMSQNWSSGYPNDMITIIEADTPYYSGAKIMGMDDFSMGGVDDWNYHSELEVDYASGRISWEDWAGRRLYGIFKVDESEERAKLKIEYMTGTYPTEFSDDALIYIERTFIARRQDGEALGVASYP